MREGRGFWECQEADVVGRVLTGVVFGRVEREEKPGLVQLSVASLSLYSCSPQTLPVAFTWVDPERVLINNSLSRTWSCGNNNKIHALFLFSHVIITVVWKRMRQLVFTICLALTAARLSRAVDFVGKSNPPHTCAHKET